MENNVALFEDGGHNDRINMLHLMLNELMELLSELEMRLHNKRPRNLNYYELLFLNDNVLFKKHFRMFRVTFEVSIINFIKLQVCLKINFDIQINCRNFC